MGLNRNLLGILRMVIERLFVWSGLFYGDIAIDLIFAANI